MRHTGGDISGGLRRGRRLLLVAAVVAATATWSSCELVTDILSWTMFPSFLSGVEATRNLTQELEDLVPEGENEFGCRLAVLRSPAYGNVDYVFLLVNTPRGNRLVVLDTSLETVNTVSDGNFGERFMVDTQGSFIVGKVRLDGADDPVPDELPISDSDTYKPGVGLPVPGYDCLLSAGAAFLYVDSYAAGWGSSGYDDFSILGSGEGDWYLAGVGYDEDPSRADQEVMLALYRWDAGNLAVFFVEDTSLGQLTLSEPLEQYATTGKGFSRTIQSVRRVHYTRNGVVVRTEEDEDQCYLLGFDGQELYRFQLKMRGGVEEAYDVEGEHFYYFSRGERVLFKGRTGW